MRTFAVWTKYLILSYIISVQKATWIWLSKKILDFPVYTVMELQAQTNKTSHHAKIYQQTPEENF
jgi:hypothetical protein